MDRPPIGPHCIPSGSVASTSTTDTIRALLARFGPVGLLATVQFARRAPVVALMHSLAYCSRHCLLDIFVLMVARRKINKLISSVFEFRDRGHFEIELLQRDVAVVLPRVDHGEGRSCARSSSTSSPTRTDSSVASTSSRRSAGKSASRRACATARETASKGDVSPA